MDEFKEFQGKDLDACIKEAGEYFNSPREKLEIEIVQDAKSGIFGIVGARKAKIRARRAQIDENMLNFLETPVKQQDAGTALPGFRSPKFRSAESKKSISGKVVKMAFQAAAKTSTRMPKKEALNTSKFPEPTVEPHEGEYLKKSTNLPEEERLVTLACETVKKLLQPIAGKEINVEAESCRGLIKASVSWEGDAGLLIGREGQTLASLQYIASRILSQALNTGIRIQLEIGDYKSRQDEKIKERAHMLAEKARQTGRSWTTPPLSSYHRRIVHMELQDEPGIMTRSTGDGIMKKVVITPKRMADSMG